MPKLSTLALMSKALALALAMATGRDTIPRYVMASSLFIV